MTNEYYVSNGQPADATKGIAKRTRKQFESTEDGFDKLPDVAPLLAGLTYNAAAGGVANAYTASISDKIASYVDGLSISLLINATNTGASTVNVNSLGIKSIKSGEGTDLAPGTLPINVRCLVNYNATAGYFVYNGPQLTTASVAAIAAATSAAITPLNYSRATVASHATTSAIWAAAGNQINFTGTETITALPAAAKAGSKRELICASTPSFTAGSNLIIAGVDSGDTITCAINDTLVVQAITTTQFLLRRIKQDGTSEVAPVFTGGGGTVNDDGNITLTAASDGAQTFDPAGYGRVVTLPDATTMTEANNLFMLDNVSNFPQGIVNNDGVKVGWMPAKTAGMVSLSDNSVAAGVWGIANLEKTAVTMEYSRAAAVSGTDTLRLYNAIELDANRTVFLFGWGNIYAICYNKSTLSFGSPVLISAVGAANSRLGIKAGTNQILVSCFSGASMYNINVSVTGTTIGTPASASTLTNAAAFSKGGELYAVGSSFVCVYTHSSGVRMRAMTVSGAGAPTVGAETSLSAARNFVPLCFVNGSILRTILNNGTTFYSQPFTIAGTGITAGTQATTSCDNNSLFRAFINSNGNIVITYLNSNVNCLAVSKLTGTTEVLSALSTVVGSGTASPTTRQTNIDLGSDKILVVAINGANWYANIVIDTAGTPTKGTAIAGLFAGSGEVIIPVGVVGDIATVGISSNTGSMTISFDCSGASAVVDTFTVTPKDATNLFISPPAGDNTYNEPYFTELLAGGIHYCMNSEYAFNAAFSVGGVNKSNSPITIERTSTGQRFGNDDSVTYFGHGLDNSSKGVIIQRIEAAA